jgi:hypothetical protein
MQVKVGDKVSLNLRKRLFFFQGENGINLNENNTSATIPETMDERGLAQINRSLVLGELIIGSIPEIPVIVPKDDDLIILMNKGKNAIDDFVYNLREDKIIKSEKKIEKFERMLELEKSNKNRKSVIAKIEFALSKIGGASRVIETDQEKIEIKLTSGTEEETTE